MIVFQPTNQPKVSNSECITTLKSKGLSDESIKTPATSNNSLSPAFNYINAKIQVKFDKNCLKLDKFTLDHKTVENIYIAFEINLWLFKQSADFALGDSLLRTFTLTKNGYFNKNRYSGYDTVFDAHGGFSSSDGSRFIKM